MQNQDHSLQSIISRPDLSKTTLVAAAICTLFATASGILYPYLTQLLIESLQEGLAIWGRVVLLSGVLLAGALFSAGGTYFLGKIGQRFVRNLRTQLQAVLLKAPIMAVETRQAADSANRVISDTRLVGGFIAQQISSAASSIITLVISIIMLLLIDLPLSAVLFACVALSFLIIFPIAAQMSGISKDIQDREAKAMGRLAEVLLNLRLVKASTAESQEEALFDETTDQLYHANMRETRITTLLSPIADTAISVSLVLVLTIGAFRVAAGALDMASLMAFILYLFNVVLPVTQLSIFSSEYHKAQGAAERMGEILSTPTENLNQGSRITSLTEDLRIQDLRFTYPNSNTPVLNIHSLDIPKGSTIALVGASGAGKSTLLSLINRMYETRGIFHGSQEIEGINLENWRRRSAFVHQNAPVLSGTVGFNLGYGLETPPSEQDCEHILTQVHLWEMLKEKEGLNTLVGEQGYNLSGGQRQRLAVARAILRQPDILLLDEATSALDSRTEREIQEALAPLMNRCTTIVAAHRLNTVIHADSIILLHGGIIQAQGSHDELMKQSPEYELLVREQLQPAGTPELV